MDPRDRVYDVLGLGFGPANLALAVTLEEQAEAGRPLDSLFLEAKPDPCWHPNMLLQDSLLQITALKDLAMVRNPRSRFTFLNYLHEKGRLYEFLNLRDLFPTRLEFNDYLQWVSNQLRHRARYGRRVESVKPVREGNEPARELEVTARDLATGETEVYRARNVVVATGGKPWVPDGIELRDDGRAFHPCQFLERVERDYPDTEAPYRFAVVGSGQSGAELFYYLATRYPNADVTAAIRRFAYKPVDESDFTNEIFFPHMVDWVYGLPDEVRRGVVDSFRDVNYAVVDTPLIRKIYRFLYDERVRGKERARVMPYQQLSGTTESGDKVTAHFLHLLNGERTDLELDGLVIATGYTWDRRHPLLEGVREHLVPDERGAYRVQRDYRLAASPDLEAGVYIQGYAEDTHGISETVLSLLPVRAGEIAESLHATREERVEVGREILY